MLGNHCNVTGLLRRLQVNIQVFKINKHGDVFKNCLCPNFLLLPKNSELPKIWGGCSPPRPPARTPMGISVHRTLGSFPLVSVLTKLDCSRFSTTPITFTRLDFHQQISDYKPVITRYLAAFLDACQIYLGGGERFGRRFPRPTLI